MTRPKSHYRGLNPERVREIRRKYFAREATQAELAREYSRTQSIISRIVSGQSWGHVA